MKKIKIITATLLSIALSACGGGDKDSSSSTGTDNGTGYVTGQFKDNGLLPDAGNIYGAGTAECINSSDLRYFESENTLVYASSTDIPDNDFKHAATIAEKQWPNALNLMGFTPKEFESKKVLYTPNVLSGVTGLLYSYAIASTDADGNYIELRQNVFDYDQDLEKPSDWDLLSEYEQYYFVASYVNSLNHADLDDLYAFADASSGEWVNGVGFFQEDANIIPKKMIICLSTNRTKYDYAQALLIGFNVAAKSVVHRGDEESVYLHEMIHYIQMNMGFPDGVPYRVLDTWFSEGEAAFLAGQKVASNHNDANPVDVYSSDYANDVPYEQYAKAYSYLNKYSSQNRKQFYLDLRSYSAQENDDYDDVDSTGRFRYAFDKNMKKHDGSQLTLREFRTDYHNLMDQAGL